MGCAPTHATQTCCAGQDCRSPNEKALDLYPSAAAIRASLAWVFAVKRIYPQALAEYDKIPDQDKAVTTESQFVATNLGWIYAVSSRRADAVKIVQEFKDLSAHAYVHFYWSG